MRTPPSPIHGTLSPPADPPTPNPPRTHSSCRREQVQLGAPSPVRVIFSFYGIPSPLSAEAMAFIDILLAIDPRRRAGVRDALRSGWLHSFANGNAASNGAASGAHPMSMAPTYRAAGFAHEDFVDVSRRTPDSSDGLPTYRSAFIPASIMSKLRRSGSGLSKLFRSRESSRASGSLSSSRRGSGQPTPDDAPPLCRQTPADEREQ